MTSDRLEGEACQECGQQIDEPATWQYAIGFAIVPVSIMVLAIVGYYLEIIPVHVYWLTIGMMGMGLVVWARPDPHILAWHREKNQRETTND